MLQAMIRLLALLLGFGAVTASAPSGADTIPRQLPFCSEVQMGNPTTGTISRMSPALIVRASEVIVDGYIESYRPPVRRGGKNLPGLVIVHVDKIWKGGVTPRITYLTWMPSWWVAEWPAQSSLPPPDCSNPIRAGVRVRIGSFMAGKVSDMSALFPDIDRNMDVLGGGRSRDLIDSWGLNYLPLRDAEFDPLLAAYQAETDSLQQAAEAGDQRAKLAFAEYLLDNNEDHRAFAIYDALARDNQDDLDLLLTLAVARTKARLEGQPDATLAVVRARAPKTEKWLSKIARARLAATGLLTAEGRDWSDLKRMHTICYSDHENFDGAIFDRAELPECAFRYSSFSNASFRGTDLTGSYFQNSGLTGAKYDCATKLPDDLDPAAAGMINTQGSCAQSAPQ
jgi:hypothetical protein